MDKVIQIFDPRYYQDRDTALKGLFTEVHLIAANRGPLGENELKEFLSRKENQVFEDRVYPFTLPEGLRDLTTTDLRTRIAKGESVQDQLPEVIEKFVAVTGAYRPVYNLRSRLLDRLYSVRAWAEKECDFEALVRDGSHDGGQVYGFLFFYVISSFHGAAVTNRVPRSLLPCHFPWKRAQGHLSRWLRSQEIPRAPRAGVGRCQVYVIRLTTFSVATT